MEPRIFPLTLLAIPLGYVLTVWAAVRLNRRLAAHSLTTRSVLGALPAALVGVVVAFVTAPATGLVAGFAYAATTTALWVGMAVRRRVFVAAVPTLACLLGTWLTAGNTATGVVAVVGIASLPVVLLGYRLAPPDSSLQCE
ncbi:hypothetical protein [Haloferax sp. DFSO60]|uniref:hypothetical protein n=1 Tax=Haloferax sp. DFSO60 TaxID=3388652 RepID=UPI00397E461F